MANPGPTRPLHHIALGARDVQGVAAFYRDVLGLSETARHHDDEGLRSIWLDAGGPLLMVERTEHERPELSGVGAGPFLLAFSVEPAKRAALEAQIEKSGGVIEDRSAFTSYARDPVGNRVGISHHPHPAEAGSA